MKTWNAPEVQELNINETASGFFNTEYEVWPFINDTLKKNETPTTTPTPTPTPEEDS